jgi:hypothetical protein
MRDAAARLAAAIALAGSTAACGYHLAGRAATVPKEVHTIAIPAFGNATVRHRLARLLAADVAREFNTRTRFRVVADPQQADAVLSGTLATFNAFPTIFDPGSNRATGAQVVVTLSVYLTDRHTGKTLFAQPGLEARERYEISTDPQAYFDESGTAIERVSRDVARRIVSAVLENF